MKRNKKGNRAKEVWMTEAQLTTHLGDADVAAAVISTRAEDQKRANPMATSCDKAKQYLVTVEDMNFTLNET